jgi:hypothetical protein
VRDIRIENFDIQYLSFQSEHPAKLSEREICRITEEEKTPERGGGRGLIH